MKKRIAVFASGGGTSFDALARACFDGSINGDVVLLVYNRKTAYVRERADNFGIEAVYMNKHTFGGDEVAMNHAVLELLACKKIDLIVLAGYLLQLGESVINSYKNCIINMHPALIPAFCGAGFYGERVHKAVLEYGVKITGCTAHFADAEMDTGPIILQRAVPVERGDNIESLAARVLVAEHAVLCEAVQLFCADRLCINGRTVEISD